MSNDDLVLCVVRPKENKLEVLSTDAGVISSALASQASQGGLAAKLLYPHENSEYKVYSSETSLQPLASDVSNQAGSTTTKGEHRHMNTVTREELDARLEASDAKTGAKLQALDAKLDSFLSSQAFRDKHLDERFERMEKSIDRVTNVVDGLSASVNDIKVEVAKVEGKIIKWLIGTGFTIVGFMLTIAGLVIAYLRLTS